MILDAVDADSLFAAGLTSSAQLATLQQRSLSQAMDLYSKENYADAIKAFRRSVAYAPSSDNAVTAFQFIAQSYSKLNDSDGAINAYKQALKIDSSRSDIYLALGNVYYFGKDYQNAVKTYEQAVRYDPSEANRYSLGQGYLANGQYGDAEDQFRRVMAMAPNKPSGAYGLGLAYEKQGQYNAAISAFKEALSVQSDFYEAYSEIGYALADSGRLDEADQISNELASLDASLSTQLSQYINSKSPPKFALVASADLNLAARPNTAVSGLSALLVEPGATQTFSVQFTFDKPMDVNSVQNVVNWTISRASGSLPATYNFGMAIADTEASLAPHPISVSYDETYQVATVFFAISQNSAGDATIDPSHIQFKFSGKDEDGLTMSSTADQYTGFSGIA